MIIEREKPNKPAGIPYGDIKTGEAFYRDQSDIDDRVFIKSDGTGCSGRISICLHTGITCSWPDSAADFHLVDAKVVVNG